MIKCPLELACLKWSLERHHSNWLISDGGMMKVCWFWLAMFCCSYTGWCFQICFIFTPKIGEIPHVWRAYFSKGLKPLARNHITKPMFATVCYWVVRSKFHHRSCIQAVKANQLFWVVLSDTGSQFLLLNWSLGVIEQQLLLNKGGCGWAQDGQVVNVNLYLEPFKWVDS